MHKSFACISPVFKAAFNSIFIEGQTQTYTLEDVDEDIFQLVDEWLYTQQLGLEVFPDFTPVTPDGRARFKFGMVKAVMLWTLADRLLLPRLQNHIMGRIFEWRQLNIVPISCLGYVYERSTPENRLRKYLVYACARSIPRGWYLDRSEDFTKDMLLEFVECFQEMFFRELCMGYDIHPEKDE